MLDRVQVEWAALQFVVSGLSDEELTAPGPEQWSVKDHLAHIAEWEHACTAVLGHQSQVEAFGVDAEAYRDIDALNEALFQRHRSATIDEVKRLANAAHADMVTAITRLQDADLRRGVGEYGMQTNPDRQLIEKIAGDTYEHYAEHTEWIKNLLNAL